MKNAQSMQFNWIFVIVAGAIILVFFVGFGMQYATLQKSRESTSISRSIDQMINGLKGQEQYKEIDINTVFNFGFKCDGYIINNDPRSYMNLSGKIIFTQKNYNVKSLYAWVKEFKRGFKVDNVIYLIDKDKKFYLINDGNEQYASEIYNQIPESFTNIKLLSLNELSNVNLIGNNNELVFFTNPEQNILDQFNSKGDILIIDPASKIVTFENGYIQQFIDETFVYGAIFSGTYETYKCSYDSLSNKFNVINNIYIKKAQNLQDCCSSGTCDYNLIIQKLIQSNINSPDSNFEELNNLNQNLANYCKVIY